MNKCLFSLLLFSGLVGLALSHYIKSAHGGGATFTEHVAPILFNHCATCHRPGEAAPFSLLNYADAKKRGKLLAAVTQALTMPPWKADKGDVEYENERRLTDAQIATIQQWVSAGMPEGDPQKLPPLPKFTDG